MKKEKLTNEELKQYQMTMMLEDIGEEGQLKLANAKVLVVGVGGLGSHVLPLLVSSGVGYIGLVDDDKVSLNNLPRQVLFQYKDVGNSKVEAAKRRLKAINPNVKIRAYNERFDSRNAERIIKGYHLVIDCTDNFDSKFFINDICVMKKKPFITGGVDDYKGQIMTYIPKISKKDFKSLFDELPKYKNEDRGIYPPIVGIIGQLMVNEVLKYLFNIGAPLIDSLMVVDTLNNKFEKFYIK